MLNIQEFIDFRRKCIVCNFNNKLWANLTIKEIIDKTTIHSLYSYSAPIIRNDFLIFASADGLVLPPGSMLDIKTFDKDKYNSFILWKDNTITFDKKFNFKLKLSFTVSCPAAHYSYSSRLIRLSNKTQNITKGYSVIAEDLMCAQYRIISNKKDNETFIYNYETGSDPIVMPYKDITSFPIHNTNKCIQKIENYILLA
jgi:hypothetical protein